MLLRDLKEKLSKEIDEKENQVRIDKRKKLIERLKDYLAIFFADKYDFDEEHFCVVYQENHYLTAGTSDERVFGGKAIGNLVKYANRGGNRNDCYLDEVERI